MRSKSNINLPRHVDTFHGKRNSISKFGYNRSPAKEDKIDVYAKSSPKGNAHTITISNAYGAKSPAAEQPSFLQQSRSVYTISE